MMMTRSKTRGASPPSYTPEIDRPPPALKHQVRMPVWLLWILALVPLSPIALGTMRVAFGVETRAHADSTYVRRDSVMLWRTRDSITLKANIDAMQKDVSALVRACQRKGDCP